MFAEGPVTRYLEQKKSIYPQDDNFVSPYSAPGGVGGGVRAYAYQNYSGVGTRSAR